MKEALFMLITLIAATGIMLGSAIGGAYYLGKRGCEARWEHTDRETSHGFFQGCLVETDGVLVPEDRIWYERNQ